MIATVYPGYGGSTKVLLAASESLSARYDVILRAPIDEATSRSPQAFPLENLSTWQRKIAILPLLVRTVMAEARFMRSCRPDLVYVHDSPSLLVYGLPARLLGITVVAHAHGNDGAGLGRRLKNRLIDAKIYVSRILRETDWSKPAFTIGNPVAIIDVADRDRAATRDIYLVGAICDRKNQILAVGIMSELRRRGHQAVLHLCGPVIEAGYAECVRVMIQSERLGDAVVFEGIRPLPEILQRADLVICPSKDEAQPLIVLEALAAGIPVVASRIAAHEDLAILVEGDGALVLAEPDASSFADRILVARSSAFPATRRRVAEHFSPRRFAAQLVHAFEEIEKVLVFAKKAPDA